MINYKAYILDGVIYYYSLDDTTDRENIKLIDCSIAFDVGGVFSEDTKDKMLMYGIKDHTAIMVGVKSYHEFLYKLYTKYEIAKKFNKDYIQSNIHTFLINCKHIFGHVRIDREMAEEIEYIKRECSDSRSFDEIVRDPENKKDLEALYKRLDKKFK